MALKGTTKIELTNVKTGEVEVIEKDNLVTNAVADVLGLNPFGMRYRNFDFYDGSRDSANKLVSKSYEDAFFPVDYNLFGGILLYEDALEENPAKYYAPMDNPLVGYSSNNVNETTDERRGSLNQTESGRLEDGSGYRFVFDFATSQANGTISSVGLTSKMGGTTGHGWKGLTDFSYNAVLVDNKAQSVDLSANYNEYCKAFISIVSIDPENNTALAAFVSAEKTITLYKFKLPLTSTGLRNNFSPALTTLEINTISTENFAAVLTSGVFYGTLIDGGDGYIWGFQHTGNAKGNSSGSASVLWIKINKEDYSFTEGTFTIDAQLLHFGDYYVPVSTSTGNRKNVNHAIIKDGVLYAIKYTSSNHMSAVYSIPLDNITDVQMFTSDASFIWDPSFWGGTDHYASTAVNEINGVIRYCFGELSGGKLRYTSSAQGQNNSSLWSTGATFMCPKPQLIYGPYIIAFCHSYTYYRRVLIYLMSTYLATINNLATPVQKTADKTMKITYILREEITDAGV